MNLETQNLLDNLKPTRLAVAASVAGGLALASIGELRNDYSASESATVAVGMTAVGLLIEPSRKLGLLLESKIQNYFGTDES